MYSLETLYIFWRSWLKSLGKQQQSKIATRQSMCLKSLLSPPVGEWDCPWMWNNWNASTHNGSHSNAVECKVDLQKTSRTQTVPSKCYSTAQLTLHSRNSPQAQISPRLSELHHAEQRPPPSRGKSGGLLICIKTSLEFSEVNVADPTTRM